MAVDHSFFPTLQIDLLCVLFPWPSILEKKVTGDHKSCVCVCVCKQEKFFVVKFYPAGRYTHGLSLSSCLS